MLQCNILGDCRAELNSGPMRACGQFPSPAINRISKRRSDKSAMSATGSTTAMADRPGRIAASARARFASGDAPAQAPVSAFPTGWRWLIAVELVVFVAIGVIYGVVPGATTAVLAEARAQHLRDQLLKNGRR